MAGRKPKLTNKLIDDAEKLIKLGNYVTTVTQYLGIHQSTWYKWMQEGEHANKGLKRELFERVKKAETHSEIRNVQLIQRAAEHDWKASMTYLERRFPDRWGRRDKMQADLNHSGQVDIHAKLTEMSDEELEKLAGEYDVDK